MCNKAVEKDPLLLIEVPDHLKTQEMCNKAVDKSSCLLVFVPDRLKHKKCGTRKCATDHGHHVFLIILGRKRRATK